VKALPPLALVMLLAACESPEAARTRGGGPGADVGNRDEVVLMHEGAQPYAKTPNVIPGKSAPVDPANQADRLSKP
jgi:hypothetical protein